MTSPRPPSLGDLSDPSHYQEPLDIAGLSPVLLVQHLRQMMTIRAVEERIGLMVERGIVNCPCHLVIGQEAVAVGVSSRLRRSDRIFGAHRSHAHYLAQGGDVYQLFAEVLGRATGCSKGMGGSMHLYDGRNGFMGSVPIVAGTVPLAVGAALAAQKDGKGDVGVAYFGDGAAEEGNVHESLNFASVFKLPVLFVCENNLFSSHLHISLRQPFDSVARFAAAHGIVYEVIDGNDVALVARSTERLLDHARSGAGPAFLEAVTYRWRGHVGPREDIDVGVKRNVDLELWKRRDPIRRLAEALEAQSAFSRGEYDAVTAEIAELVETEWRRAEDAPYPDPSAILGGVYADA